MNLLESVIAAISPNAAVKRMAARQVLSQYEAAKPSKQRKFRTENASANTVVGMSAKQIRNQVRYLEKNHDIVRGALRTMVNNIVGPNGIGVEPQPRKRGTNEIHEEYAKALRDGWRDWQKKPEVTWQFRWPAVQRMAAKTWIRDGEMFAQTIIGPVQFLDHGTAVPFSLELIEPDMVPLDYDEFNTSSGNIASIRQGIARNTWGRSIGYYVLKADPLESGLSSLKTNMKYVPAERMLHIASVDRISQLRGVSDFASVITRLEDIKDYEESERVAAKIAAMLTAYVKRGTPEMYDADNAERDSEGNIIPSQISLSPGTIVDSLAIGEEIGLIDSKRPNPNVVTFRQGQLRAAAAGIGAGYSSISRDYNGTYSSQRQELVEQWIHYACMTDDFVGQFVQPTWERFVLAAKLSGAIKMPHDVEPGTEDDALFVGQSMPWIDPVKEAAGWLNLVQAGFASEVEVMRKRGVNPRDVLEQIDTFRKESQAKNLVFSSNFANQSTSKTESAPVDNSENADNQNAEATVAALAGLASGIGILASRDQPTPNVIFNQAATTVNLAETHVEVAAPVVNVAAAEITVENKVEPTPITMSNNIEVPPAQVIINAHKRSVQSVERDEKTQEVIRTVTDFE
jgi:lambda family phage portal protein